MLFNSYAYILFFLPTVAIGYFILNRKKLPKAGNAWLSLASIFFYGWWNFIYVPLLLGSICFNFLVGKALTKPKRNDKQKKYLLILGLLGNLGLLGFFKYYDFFIGNINELAGTSFSLMHLILPLGISFFTFTQIAFLVDAKRGMAKEYNLVNYSLFVTFFPHLLAGPILHHREMMPQFDNLRNKFINPQNISLGIFLFTLGLAKKILIADELAFYTNAGFDTGATLTFLEAWSSATAYGLQIYFDFSGYTDMALGSSLIFNIHLPENFNSPLKSLNFQEFWQRWHMTLGRFLRDYVYFPLGGSRAGELNVYRNLMLTFIICGIWHGAGWTYFWFGFVHGLGLCINRFWKKYGRPLPALLAWPLTIFFYFLSVVIIRSTDVSSAIAHIKAMLEPWNLKIPKGWAHLKAIFPWAEDTGTIMDSIPGALDKWLVLTILGLAGCLLLPNSNQLVKRFKPSVWIALALTALGVYCLINLNKTTQFLYFQF